LVWPGVDQPFGDFGAFDMNQGVYTMMSYNTGWATSPQGLTPDVAYGHEMGPMAFDIAALQVMYGKNMSYRTGDGGYRLPDANEVGTGYSCIWDAGGYDRFIGAESRSNHIDLRAATLKFEAGGGGYLSYAQGVHGGFTIANGVTIERTIGGAKGDWIRGNAANNRIEGLGGADSLWGSGGRDSVLGGSGADSVWGGDGNDVLRGGTGADRIWGGTGNDDFVYTTKDDSRSDASDRISNFVRGQDEIVLTAIDANGSGSGNGAFRLDTGGTFARGEIRQSFQDGNLHLRLNLDSDSFAEMKIVLLSRTTKVGTDDFQF
jgi:serralysin